MIVCTYFFVCIYICECVYFVYLYIRERESVCVCILDCYSDPNYFYLRQIHKSKVTGSNIKKFFNALDLFANLSQQLQILQSYEWWWRGPAL